VICRANVVCICLIALWHPAAHTAEFNAGEVLKAASEPLDESPAKEIASLKLDAKLKRVAISADGKSVLAFGDGFELYSADTLKPLGKQPAKPLREELTLGALSSNGKLELLASKSTAWLLDPLKGTIIATIPAKETTVGYVGFLEKDQAAVVITADAGLQRVDVKSGKIESLPPQDKYRLRQGMVETLSPDGKWFGGLPLQMRGPFLFHFQKEGKVYQSTAIKMPPALTSAAISNSWLLGTTTDAQMHTQHHRLLDGVQFQTFHFGQFQLKSGLSHRPQAISVSTDQRWAIRIGEDGVDVIPIGAVGFSAFHYVDVAEAACAAAPDAMRVAVLKENRLGVYQLPSAESPPGDFAMLITQLVIKQRFDDLDALGELLADDETFFPWGPQYNKYELLTQRIHAAAHPDVLPFDIAQFFKKWREAKPKSVLTRVAASFHSVNVGFMARGEGAAFEVTPEGRRVLRDQSQEAYDLIKPLLDSPRPPLQTYALALEIARAQGWETEDRQPHIEALLKRKPNYYAAHLQEVNNLMRRWGGEPEEDQKYAARVANAIGDVAGDEVYARLGMHLATIETPEDFLEVSKFDGDRILRGWKSISAKDPSYGSVGELYMAEYLEDRARSAEVVARIERDHLHYAPGLLRSPVLYYGMLAQAKQRKK
jgi:hypothetical protein